MGVTDGAGTLTRANAGKQLSKDGTGSKTETGCVAAGSIQPVPGKPALSAGIVACA